MALWDNRILVGDGAMGTMLMARGLQLGECPEALNLRCPEVVTEIASLYIEAGADFVTTNTFGGSALRLAYYDLAGRTEEINEQGVRAARSAAGNTALVNFSVGPCGQILRPYGDADPDAVRSSFVRQIAAGIAAGIDLISIETMTDLGEALLALEAARSLSTDIPIIATMTFDPTPRGFFTIMGASVENAARKLFENGADAIGSNCGYGIEHMIAVAEEFRRHTRLPLVIQANAGLPENRGIEVYYPETPEFLASKVPKLIASGVRIIGGCCGTTPEHIRAIRGVVNRLQEDE